MISTLPSTCQPRLAAEIDGGVECGWLHDVLAHCAYFEGDVERGLEHGEAEIARARADGDPYRLSYVLADSGTHATLAGRNDIGLERSIEALALADQIGNPSARSMAQMAYGFAHREHDPIQAIHWLSQAADLADTVDSAWTAAVCRGELTVLLALHGDPLDALELGLDRRAGDDARARGVIRMAIPALHKLLDERHFPDLVALDAGTANRPHIREQFNDQAVAAVRSRIGEAIGQDAIDAAEKRGHMMEDRRVFELGHQAMQSALGAEAGA